MKILVVDDEQLIREVIKEYLENDNYEVIEASNGEEAIDKALKNDISLIIMDIMMPKLDGFSACKEIFKTKSIPTIMLSARGEEYDKLLGFDLGIDDYITKEAKVKILKTDEEKSQSRLEITIHEGKNRQVRKMCEAIGHKVLALHRSKIAGIGVKDLSLGKWRYLSKEEVNKILNQNVEK